MKKSRTSKEKLELREQNHANWATSFDLGNPKLEDLRDSDGLVDIQGPRASTSNKEYEYHELQQQFRTFWPTPSFAESQNQQILRYFHGFFDVQGPDFNLFQVPQIKSTEIQYGCDAPLSSKNLPTC